MFREMRRIGNKMDQDQAVSILKAGTNGVLGVIGDSGYPYTVPVSYVYDEGNIYFHSATEGHKLDAIQNEPKVSFCVTAQDNIIAEDFNTLYKSVIVFGKAEILVNEESKRDALESILKKYSADFIEKGREYIKEEWDNCVAVRISIEHMSGKFGD